MLKVFLFILFTISSFLFFQKSIKAQEISNTGFRFDLKSLFVDDIFQNVWNFISGIFRDINYWLDSNLGLNLFEIIKTVGNFIIWILELAIKFIKLIISLI